MNAKAVAKKTTSRKAATKKATSKKATAKKSVAKKVATKKAVAKKPVVKKVVAKKVVAKKAAAKKTPAVKAAASKSASRKTTLKKTSSRKTAAKKSNARKKAAKKAVAAKPKVHLKNISEVRRYFHRNDDPIFFISATNFNLLGIDEWCKNFKFINYINCYDNRHPNTFVPSEAPHPEFESIEDIVAYLLEHKEVIDFIKSKGGKPKAVFLMFDERVEKICKELGIEVWFPKAALREHIDHKIETVRIGDKAGVPSVPNVLSEVKDYEHLRKLSKPIGNDLVLQSAFGDSGHTTFFIKNEKDFKK